ncbi:MAG: lecithin retinol acyltransferase family protein [Crocinitomicaceae bacterium]|nr:lecithin retinol acyltransferase family protein [Crocinitomicaceae bacterium]
MTLDQFIRVNAIRPADAIIMRKKFFGMVDHYVIYLGQDVDHGQHIFVANYTKGVCIIENVELAKFLIFLVPSNIDRFYGDEFERENAIRRAISKIGKKAYNYLENNCEHFKNWVHRGEHKSEQADNFKTGLAIGVGTVAVVGLLALIFGRRN